MIVSSFIRSQYSDFETIINKTFITKTVKKDGTGDYLTVEAANAAITDSAINKWYEIVIYDDWCFTQRDQLSNDGSEWYFFKTKSYIKYRGAGTIKTISAIMPNTLTINEIIHTNPIYMDGYCIIENIQAIGYNTKYAVHSDRGLNPNINTDAIQVVFKCYLNNLGSNSWTSPEAWGSGSSSGEKMFHIDSTYENETSPTFYIHTNSDFTNPNTYILQNLNLISNQKDISIKFDELGSNINQNIIIDNVKLNGSLSFNASFYKNAAIQEIDCFFPNIIVKNTLPFLNIIGGYGSIVVAFKGVSKTADSIIDIIGGTAMSLVIGSKNKKNGSLFSVSYVRGNIGIPTNYFENAKYSGTLGHRLGDCSSVNKTLIFNINGVEHTLIFDKDYSGGNINVAPLYDLTAIKNDIESKLGAYLTVDYPYPVNDVYFSSYIETLENGQNNEYITKGTFVSKVSGRVKKAANGEVVYGVSLDNILPYQNLTYDSGRILTKGIFDTSVGYGLFKPLIDNYVYTEGQKFKINGTSGVLTQVFSEDYCAIAKSDKIIEFNL